MKLLVVDDHPLMGETIDYIIKNKRPMFHYVGQALSGKKGLEMVAMNTPDILLADIMMPGMDGLTMIQQLKDVFPAVKVVIITAYDDFTFVQRALRMGAVDYLLKPFKPETLLSILDKIYEELEDKQLAVSNPYPALISQLYHRLSNQIQNGQIEQASILFQEIWQELTSSVKSDTVLIRTRSVEIATAIIHLTDEKSYCHEALTLTYSTFISKVAKTQTADDIELCLKEFLQTCSEVFYQYSSQSEYEIISRIKELIEMNLKKNITLESVAQKVYLNPSYLSRLFKQKTKVNFIDYLIERRLERAKILLATTDFTVEFIAAETGYHKPNSFRRLFKKKVGISPSEYRVFHTKQNQEA